MKTKKNEFSERHTRRQFFTSSASTVLGCGVSLAAAGSWNRILGANDRIHLGVVGTGVRGQGVLAHFQKNPEVEVGALCDIYDVNLQQTQKQVGGKAKEFLEHRALLDLKDIDAVLIATPDHWHAQIAIDACQAGKDVYVEKPLSKAGGWLKLFASITASVRSAFIGVQSPLARKLPNSCVRVDWEK